MIGLGRGKEGQVTHVRLEQVVDGLRVHGAYVKATLGDDGRLLHIIDRVARGSSVAVRASVVPQDALISALAHLGYAPSALQPSGERGNLTSFARTSELYRDPSVERVAYADDSGALREGFLVETWSLKGNQLDYTLIDGNGAVVSSERRTNNDRYNVFVEDPLKGAQTTVSGPAAGGVQSPNGWLGTGSQTTINISGNNAHAYLDADANNAPDTGGTAVTNGDFLTAVNLSQSPTTTGNRNVAVQNLFYLNNVVHDSLYAHGFNETEGNFQINNFGRGGLGNDPVNAEAQDGSGTDNANFSTPNDGSSPRMQMYLWTGAGPDSFVTVGGTSYGAYQASFGAALTTTGISGAMALYNDGTGVATDGCEASTTSLTGRIALVDRGTCNFTVKVLNAQNAGATGVIIMNNTGADDAFAPGGTERKVKIPSVMVSLNSGNVLRTQSGTTAQLRHNSVTPLQIDGDIDADVVFHEYGHGLTWRMIGGMSGPLAGAIGEGASDVVAFLHNGDDRIGEYAFSNPLGIRRQPYANYQGSYASVTGAEVHDDGEIYAAAMYRLWQNYLAAGYTTNTVLDDFVGGMRFTPSTPTYEQMRDGMLQQTAGTGRECLIWRAFAAYGIGVGASGTVSRTGTVTIVESFAVPSTCP
ncbi:MAG TPA: M36 family metallopeptidase [Polyangia bacterium]|nr:M36 family metallopeptidase [Polyangia bacterium]